MESKTMVMQHQPCFLLVMLSLSKTFFVKQVFYLSIVRSDFQFQNKNCELPDQMKGSDFHFRKVKNRICHDLQVNSHTDIAAPSKL